MTHEWFLSPIDPVIQNPGMRGSIENDLPLTDLVYNFNGLQIAHFKQIPFHCQLIDCGQECPY